MQEYETNAHMFGTICHELETYKEKKNNNHKRDRNIETERMKIMHF